MAKSSITPEKPSQTEFTEITMMKKGGQGDMSAMVRKAETGDISAMMNKAEHVEPPSGKMELPPLEN